MNQAMPDEIDGVQGSADEIDAKIKAEDKVKADELKRLNVAFEELRTPADLVPGLVLARYGRVDEAQEAVRRLVERKVRGARVVQLNAPIVSHHLRLPKADAMLQASAQALRDQLLGKPFVACDK